MSADSRADDLDRRLTALLGALRESRPPSGIDLPRAVVRRARRQRAALAIVHLLVAVARTLPDAISMGTGRRR